MAQNISQAIGGVLNQQKKNEESLLANIRVAIPGIIQAFDPVEQTVRVQPTIREVITGKDYTPTPIPLPELLDVPIVLPRAGDYVVTMPIQAGDECLVIFADMCIDAWWQNGGVQNQMEQRRHDLSDGFAILGTWSQPRRLSNYDANAMQLYNYKTGTGITVNNQGIRVTGNVEITGNILTRGNSELKGEVIGPLMAKGVDLTVHTHAGVHGQTGGPQ